MNSCPYTPPAISFNRSARIRGLIFATSSHASPTVTSSSESLRVVEAIAAPTSGSMTMTIFAVLAYSRLTPLAIGPARNGGTGSGGFGGRSLPQERRGFPGFTSSTSSSRAVAFSSSTDGDVPDFNVCLLGEPNGRPLLRFGRRAPVSLSIMYPNGATSSGAIRSGLSPSLGPAGTPTPTGGEEVGADPAESGTGSSEKGWSVMSPNYTFGCRSEPETPKDSRQTPTHNRR